MTYIELSQTECGFGYRSSIFNSGDRGRFIVTQVAFELLSHAESNISYKDIQLYFKGRGAPPTLAEVTPAVREIRHGKGMLLVAGEEDCRSAGSFFKNPQLSPTALPVIADSLGIAGEDVPQFTGVSGRVKVPAAWLLEKAGFHKGYRLGRAGLSSRHTLALINTGDASAADILALRDQIVERVRTRFGIELETEPVMP